MWDAGCSIPVDVLMALFETSDRDNSVAEASPAPKYPLITGT